MLFVLEVMFNDSKDVDRRIVDSIKNGRNNAVFLVDDSFLLLLFERRDPMSESNSLLQIIIDSS